MANAAEIYVSGVKDRNVFEVGVLCSPQSWICCAFVGGTNQRPHQTIGIAKRKERSRSASTLKTPGVAPIPMARAAMAIRCEEDDGPRAETRGEHRSYLRAN